MRLLALCRRLHKWKRELMQVALFPFLLNHHSAVPRRISFSLLCQIRLRTQTQICARTLGSDERKKEPLLIYTAQGSPFRCKRLSVINGSPERNNVQKLNYTYKHYTNTDNINRKLRTKKDLKVMYGLKTKVGELCTDAG